MDEERGRVFSIPEVAGLCAHHFLVRMNNRKKENCENKSGDATTRERTRTLFFGIATPFFFGLCMLPTCYHIYMNHRARSWRRTTARVVSIHASVENVPIGRDATMMYEYRVAGELYRGTRLAFLSSGSIGDSELIQSTYKKGDVISVYVNPEQPSQSVVLPREFHLKYVWKQSLLCFFGAIAFYLLLNRVFPFRRARKGDGCIFG